MITTNTSFKHDLLYSSWCSYLNCMYLLVIFRETNPKAADRILRIRKYDHRTFEPSYNLGGNNCYTVFNIGKTINPPNERKCSGTVSASPRC